MKTFTFESVEESYRGLTKELLDNGNEVSPRNIPTLELTPVSITINNPRRNVISSKVRKLNYGFMCGELIWILSGQNDLSITHYNKNWESFSDDGKTLNGAYGKRIFDYRGNISNIDQFDKVYNLLKEDKNTRQATIVLFDPDLDFKETKDKPCTNLLRFSIRDNKLNMLCFMRSNDIILGYPYDIFNFTSMQAILASMLNVEVGVYTHVVDSFHLYKSDLDLAQNIVEEKLDSIYNNEDSNLVYKKPVEVIQNVANVEYSTRTLANELDLATIISMINGIDNEYWKSIAAMLALYNLRKARRKQAELDKIKSYIKNEFSYFLYRYNELS